MAESVVTRMVEGFSLGIGLEKSNVESGGISIADPDRRQATNFYTQVGADLFRPPL